jgi:3-oxoacyl-[acyl-carrier-protein] synthase-1
MITIAGGELISALGSGKESIQALAEGVAKPGSICLDSIAEQPHYPYYRIDADQRVAHTDHVEQYLYTVVSSLFEQVFTGTVPPATMGVFLGSSSIDYSLTRPIERVVDGLAPVVLPCTRVGGGFYAHCLMEQFGLSGPSLTINTACTSSINALMEAASMLECRVIDYALVLGLELMLPVIVEGFALMQLLSPDVLRPFAQDRNGMVLGEAVSAVLLSRDDVLPAEWRYLGGQSSCEIYSVAGSDPAGTGIAKVICQALDIAQTVPEQLTAVKAHGTGGDLMDLAEIRGMEKAFSVLPPYFSLKPFIGHTLGGCGLAELVLAMESINNGFIPATPNASPLDEQFSVPPISHNLHVEQGRFMLNYFGFGGNNTSCIIERNLP